MRFSAFAVVPSTAPLRMMFPLPTPELMKLAVAPDSTSASLTVITPPAPRDVPSPPVEFNVAPSRVMVGETSVASSEILPPIPPTPATPPSSAPCATMPVRIRMSPPVSVTAPALLAVASLSTPADVLTVSTVSCPVVVIWTLPPSSSIPPEVSITAPSASNTPTEPLPTTNPSTVKLLSILTVPALLIVTVESGVVLPTRPAKVTTPAPALRVRVWAPSTVPLNEMLPLDPPVPVPLAVLIVAAASS